LGRVRNIDEGVLVKLDERGHHRHAPHELGDEPVLEQVLGLEARQDLAELPLVLALDISAETHGLLADALFDDGIDADKSAAADEQDVRRVHLDEFLVGMLAAALGRDRRNGAFNELQERLLDAFAGNISRDRRVLRLAADLVYLVDIDDAALGPLDVIVGILQELQDDVLNVLAT